MKEYFDRIFPYVCQKQKDLKLEDDHPALAILRDKCLMQFIKCL